MVLHHGINFMKLFKYYCFVLVADKYEFFEDDAAGKSYGFHRSNKVQWICYFSLNSDQYALKIQIV